MRTLIIIPTYNEVLNIERLLFEILEKVVDCEILVVDDNSTDGTIQVAQQVIVRFPQVHLLLRPHKTGLGDAYRAGFSWAIEHAFDRVIQMDADGSHRVEDLVKMLNIALYYDVVIGSRWIPGGKILNWPISRFILSRLGNLYGRFMLRIPIKDATAGFRIYSKEALIKAKILDSTSQGYVFQLENSVRVTESQLSINEVPITFVERAHGDSKMSGTIVIEAMMNVTLWGLRGRLLKRDLFIK